MCHEGNEVYQGSLAEYDLDRNFAVVIIRTSLDVDAGLFKRVVGSLPRGMVLALGRSISGRLMVTSVMLPGDLSKSEDHDLICKMAEVHLSYYRSILFCFCYYIHQIVSPSENIFFFSYVTLVLSFHLVQM